VIVEDLVTLAPLDQMDARATLVREDRLASLVSLDHVARSEPREILETQDRSDFQARLETLAPLERRA